MNQWTIDSLSSDLMAHEVQAWRARGVDDPFVACDGLRWWRDQLELNPTMTAEELRQLYVEHLAAGTARRQWTLGFLENQGERLFPRFRDTMLKAARVTDLARLIIGGYAFTTRERALVKARLSGRSVFYQHAQHSKIEAFVNG